MQTSQYIQDQLTKLRSRLVGRKEAIEQQERNWQKVSQVLRTALLVARIVAATGCILPFLLFLFRASHEGIGKTAIVVSFVFVGTLAVYGGLTLLAQQHQKRTGEMTNAYNENLDMIAVMESLMKEQAPDVAGDTGAIPIPPEPATPAPTPAPPAAPGPQ